jgi:hypothetical protein
VLIHRCTNCGRLRLNKTAGDDNVLLLMRLAALPLTMPFVPFAAEPELAGNGGGPARNGAAALPRHGGAGPPGNGRAGPPGNGRAGPPGNGAAGPGGNGGGGLAGSGAAGPGGSGVVRKPRSRKAKS